MSRRVCTFLLQYHLVVAQQVIVILVFRIKGNLTLPLAPCLSVFYIVMFTVAWFGKVGGEPCCMMISMTSTMRTSLVLLLPVFTESGAKSSEKLGESHFCLSFSLSFFYLSDLLLFLSLSSLASLFAEQTWMVCMWLEITNSLHSRLLWPEPFGTHSLWPPFSKSVKTCSVSSALRSSSKWAFG